MYSGISKVMEILYIFYKIFKRQNTAILVRDECFGILFFLITGLKTKTLMSLAKNKGDLSGSTHVDITSST
jgi:hypothetical protein